jgi:nucleoside 2-deoxyribosyltransferase
MVYVAGPYRADTWGEVIANVGRASDVAATLLRDGHNVICPHTMTHTFEMHKLPDEVFLRCGIAQLVLCDAVVLVTGGKDYRLSSGTVGELLEAQRRCIPVFGTPGALSVWYDQWERLGYCRTQLAKRGVVIGGPEA